MTNLDFPASPALGQVFNNKWEWNGTSWSLLAAGAGFNPADFLPLVGGTLTGPLELPDVDATDNEAVRFKQLATYLPLAGGTLTGALTLPNTNATGNQAVRYNQLNQYMPLSREATATELRAGVLNKVIGTTALQGALGFVHGGDASGGYWPDFHNFINLQVNLVGNTTLAFPVVSIQDIWGRSGLLLFSNNVACTLSFQGGSGARYSFHRYEAPDMETSAGWWNLFSYTIWGTERIHLAFLGAMY